MEPAAEFLGVIQKGIRIGGYRFPLDSPPRIK